MLKALDLAWGYCINLPDEASSYILWRSRLEVQRVLGKISPGIAFHDGVHGILFQVNPEELTAEARHLNVGEETVRAGVFEIPEIKYPLDLMLEYNAVTNRCSAHINADKIFDIKLPYRNIPLPAGVSAIEIVTSSPDDELARMVAYGDLSLQCE